MSGPTDWVLRYIKHAFTFFFRYQLSVHIRRVHGAQEAFKHGMHEVSLVAPTAGEQAPPGGAESSSFTVFMCEECNSVFLTQDSLAVHILAEHMRHGWVEGSTSGGVSITEAPDAVIEVTTTVDKMYAEDNGGTIETFVSINDPSSSRDKIVSLLQPLVEKTLKVVEEQKVVIDGEIVENVVEENNVEENIIEDNVEDNFVEENIVEENVVEENKPQPEQYFILDNSTDDHVVKGTVDGVVLEVRESYDRHGYVIVPSALETLLAATELHQNEEYLAVEHTIEIPVTTTEGVAVTEGSSE